MEARRKTLSNTIFTDMQRYHDEFYSRKNGNNKNGTVYLFYSICVVFSFDFDGFLQEFSCEQKFDTTLRYRADLYWNAA